MDLEEHRIERPGTDQVQGFAREVPRRLFEEGLHPRRNEDLLPGYQGGA